MRAAWTRWTGIPNRKEFSWGEWPFCLPGAFTRTYLLGHGLRIRLGSCSRVSTEGKRNPVRLLLSLWGWCNRLENWEVWAVSCCRSSFSGNRGLHLEAYWSIISTTLWRSKRTSMLQKPNGDTYRCNSSISQSPRELWSWDGHLGMSTIVARGLDLWTPVIRCRLSLGMRV